MPEDLRLYPQDTNKQRWFYDQKGPSIILGPLEVSISQDQEKTTYTFTYPVLWRRSLVDSGDKPLESGEDSGNGSPESLSQDAN